MRKKIDPVVDEAIETLNMKDGPSRRRLLEGAGLFSATAAASALIAACSSSSSSSAGTSGVAKAAAGNFPTTPKWQFTFVNHVTDNSFFTPTQYGFADAAAILGIPTPVVSATSFISPINAALSAGIPVITYNANGATASPTNGLAYVGQDLYVSGQEVGTRLASLMKKGDTAGGLLAPPRFGTSRNKFGLVGKVPAGGFDLEPQTLTAVAAGQIDFTIDQSPYLQGFLPTIYMYLWQLSGGLGAPATTDTGLKFVTKSNVAPYTSTPTRFEGSTTAQKYIKHTGAISV